MKLSQLIEGWRNHLLPPSELREFIHTTSQQRLSQCIECSFNTTQGQINGTSRCSACGCFLEPKSKCLSCNCGLERYNELNPSTPLALKWQAVADPSIEEEIDEALKQNP